MLNESNIFEAVLGFCLSKECPPPDLWWWTAQPEFQVHTNVFLSKKPSRIPSTICEHLLFYMPNSYQLPKVKSPNI